MRSPAKTPVLHKWYRDHLNWPSFSKFDQCKHGTEYGFSYEIMLVVENKIYRKWEDEPCNRQESWTYYWAKSNEVSCGHGDDALTRSAEWVWGKVRRWVAPRSSLLDGPSISVPGELGLRKEVLEPEWSLEFDWTMVAIFYELWQLIMELMRELCTHRYPPPTLMFSQTSLLLSLRPKKSTNITPNV